LTNARVDRFTGLIIDAATLRLHGIERDWLINKTSFGKSDNVIYAVDTDIVKLFCDPAHPGYGRAFRSDPDDHVTALSALLGQYIFYELSKLPMFQLDPHSGETGAVYDGVASAAFEENPADKFLTELSDLLSEEEFERSEYTKSGTISEFRKEILDGHKSDQEKDEFFEDRIGKILNIVFPSHNKKKSEFSRYDYLNEFSKYINLRADGRLVTQQKFVEALNSVPQLVEVAGTLTAKPSIFELIEDSQRKFEWLEKLAEKNSRRAPRLLEIDADALTALERLNINLREFNIKVVLITGDQAIHHAIKEIERPTNGVQNALVVHPVAFLVDALASQTAPESAQEPGKRFQKWLDGILTPYTGNRWEFADKVRRLASQEETAISEIRKTLRTLYRDIDADIDPYDRAIKDWEALKKPAINLNIGYSADNRSIFRRLIIEGVETKDSESLKRSINELRSYTLSRMDALWDGLLIRFTSTGVRLLYALRGGSGQNQRLRNPPVIRFDSFKEATKLVAEITKKHKLSEISSPSIEERLSAIKGDALSDELGNTDLGYLSCLVYAAVCASENKWYISRGLAERAVRIAQSGQAKTKDGSIISGREAYYMQACATRLTIQMSRKTSVLDEDLKRANKTLDFCDTLLDQANDALNQELMAFETSAKNKTIRGRRFAAEKFAVAITKLHLKKWFENEHNVVAECAIQILKEIIVKIDEYMDVSPRIDMEYRKYDVPDFATPNLIINSLQCVHLCLSSKFEKEAVNIILDHKIFRQTDELFNSGKEKSHSGFHMSFLIEYYLTFKEILQKKLIKNIDEKLNIDFDIRKIQEYKVMPYDVERFSNLLAFCKEHALRNIRK
jgi:hypothetical protein